MSYSSGKTDLVVYKANDMTDRRAFPPISDNLDQCDTFAFVNFSLNMLQMFSVVEMKLASSLTSLAGCSLWRQSITVTQSPAGQQGWKSQCGFPMVEVKKLHGEDLRVPIPI